MITREALNDLMIDAGLVQYKPCKTAENKKIKRLLDEGNPLPDHLVKDRSISGKYYEVAYHNLSESELELYIKLKQLHSIETIKVCVLSITVIIAIGFIGSFFG